MASALKTSGHMAVFSLLARAAFMAAQNSNGQKSLDHLDVMVSALESVSMFREQKEDEIGCVEVGIPVEEVCALRHRAEREVFRQNPSKWDPRVSKKEDRAIVFVNEGKHKGRSN